MASSKSSVQIEFFDAASGVMFPPAHNSEYKLKDIHNSVVQKTHLYRIYKLISRLANHFSNQTLIHKSLTRQLVSFQANKQRPAVRWYKYKEAFSTPLIDYLLSSL